MYLYALLLIRMLGSRTLGQLSLVEFLMVIGIGSAVGDPMLYADVPLTHGMVVITVVVLLNRGIIALSNKQEQFERVLEGVPRIIVQNGRMKPDGMEGAKLSRESLFELLRMHGIRHLGEVECAFMEQSGQLSVFEAESGAQRDGLRVMPPWDIQTPMRWESGQTAKFDHFVGCECCGHVLEPNANALSACPVCDGESWVDAVARASDGVVSPKRPRT